VAKFLVPKHSSFIQRLCYIRIFFSNIDVKKIQVFFPSCFNHNSSMWRAPKSRVEPTWGSNYVELRKVGTRKALPTSSTREG
jgi:hypothetical protein